MIKYGAKVQTADGEVRISLGLEKEDMKITQQEAWDIALLAYNTMTSKVRMSEEDDD